MLGGIGCQLWERVDFALYAAAQRVPFAPPAHRVPDFPKSALWLDHFPAPSPNLVYANVDSDVAGCEAFLWEMLKRGETW